MKISPSLHNLYFNTILQVIFISVFYRLKGRQKAVSNTQTIKNTMSIISPIGIFDSGYGGLTVMREIAKQLPSYDYIYLGDNARTPYGGRSFDSVYRYTLEAVEWLFDKNCHLIILACNTASAKALRSIQQQNLPQSAPDRRVLGVIRPVSEVVGTLSRSGHIGILATSGTVKSQSYPIEINKFFPDLIVHQEACPLWVPLVENNEINNPGAEYFINRHLTTLLQKDPLIDVVALGCTHYPLLIKSISKYLPPSITIVNQGTIVAGSLADYLKRHPEIETAISVRGKREFYTTDSFEDFDRAALNFYGSTIQSEKAVF